MTGGGREGELDIREWMFLTLALKKSMKLLHLSSVATIGEDDCVFRRYFLVEKKMLRVAWIVIK